MPSFWLRLDPRAPEAASLRSRLGDHRQTAPDCHGKHQFRAHPKIFTLTQVADHDPLHYGDLVPYLRFDGLEPAS